MQLTASEIRWGNEHSGSRRFCSSPAPPHTSRAIAHANVPSFPNQKHFRDMLRNAFIQEKLNGRSRRGRQSIHLYSRGYIFSMIRCTICIPVTACQPNKPTRATFSAICVYRAQSAPFCMNGDSAAEVEINPVIPKPTSR